MKLKGRESRTWHTKVSDTVGSRKPTDPDFPWTALQNHTGYYMKKKGRLSQEQVDQRLLSLIDSHDSKEIAIAACANDISVGLIRDKLAHDWKINHDSSFGPQNYFQSIVATHHVKPGAVNDIEVRWARYLVNHARPGDLARPLGRQVQDLLSLLPDHPTLDMLLYAEINDLADHICAVFAEQLETLRRGTLWWSAYEAIGWLSKFEDGGTLDIATIRAGSLLFKYVPTWRSWAAWRPFPSRLYSWQHHAALTSSSLQDLLELEGPDFSSVESNKKRTYREKLVDQSLTSSESSVKCGKIRINFNRNPFRRVESLESILERVTKVIDFSTEAGHDYIALLKHLLSDRIICDEILQILEGVQLLEPQHVKVVLQAFGVSSHTAFPDVGAIRQLLPKLNNPRCLVLRKQLTPYTVSRVSDHLRELQSAILIRMGTGDSWIVPAVELLVVTQDFYETGWLKSELDSSLQAAIASRPLLIAIETLSILRDSIQSSAPATLPPLITQIDAYCKALLIPGHTLDPEICDLLEVLIAVWQKSLDNDCCRLSLFVADLPGFSGLVKCGCLWDIPSLTKSQVKCILEAVEAPYRGCFALVKVLVLEFHPDVLRHWLGILLFALEKQHEVCPSYALEHLSVEAWFELLADIRTIFEGSTVLTPHRCPRLLDSELHDWSKKLTIYISTLKRLESKIQKQSVKQLFLSGYTVPKNERILQILYYAKNSSSKYHFNLADKTIALLRDDNIDEIEDALSAISKVKPWVTVSCLLILDAKKESSSGFAEVALASKIREANVSETDALALQKVSNLFEIRLDAEGNPSAAGLDQVADSLHTQYLSLMTEAQRLENLRLSLRAIAPQDVSRLLSGLQIEAPSIVDDMVASLPSSLSAQVERISKTEVELQFSCVDLSKLQRFAIGAVDTDSFLLRLTLGHDGKPTKFCVHLSSELKDQMNTIQHSTDVIHSPWEIFRGVRPPHEHYCGNRPNRGTFQISRIVWHHLRHNFKSLEHTHDHITSKITKFGQGCVAAEIWQDPPVMDLLLAMVYAAASHDKLDLLAGCPISDVEAVKTILDGLPTIQNIAVHLRSCSDNLGLNYSLSTAMYSYCAQLFEPDMLASSLLWACTSYRGFLISATGPQRIPSFGTNQFLLANTAPELEEPFYCHMSAMRQPTSQILFHGTSLDRLHAILCQGLRVQSGTSLQTNGAAYGAGIYMADEPSMAWSYSTESKGGWKSSKFKNMKLLLGCELAGEKPTAPYSGLYVITDPTRLAVRYIFLLGAGASMPAAKDVRLPMASIFQSLRTGTL